MPKLASRAIQKDAKTTHIPTTDIIERIRKATPNQDLLLKVVITDAIGKDLLTLNDKNRDMREYDLEKMIKDMANNRWFYGCNTIKVDANLRLVDGQKEIWASILSKKPQVFCIQCGIDPLAFPVIDTQRNKTVGDTLRTAGFTDVNNLASAVRLVIYLTKYQRSGGTLPAGNKVDSQIVLEWVRDKKKIEKMNECLDFSRKTLRKYGKFLTASVWASIYYIFDRIDPATGKDFVEKLASDPKKSGPDRPIFLLQKKLEDIKGKIGVLERRDIHLRLIMRAWNAWRVDEYIEKLVPETELPTIEKPI